jgi:hypothetical protein
MDVVGRTGPSEAEIHLALRFNVGPEELLQTVGSPAGEVLI